MEINSNKLVKFFKKVSMNYTLSNLILDFDIDGLKILSMTPDNVAMVQGVLHSKKFINYEAFGKIGLGDFTTLIKILQGFKEITIIKKENVIVLKEKRNIVDVPQLSIDLIEAPKKGMPTLEFNDIVEINPDIVKEFITKSSFNEDRILKISTQEKSVTLISEGKYKFETSFDSECTKGSVISTYSEQLFNVFKDLTDNVTIELSQNYPIAVTEVTDDSTIKFIVAPRIED